MKFLNIFLIAVFVTLTIMLLLFKDCSRVTPPEPEVITPPPVVVRQPVQPPQEPTEPNDEIDRANEVGQSGELKITLLWDVPADLDLHVTVPSGNEISFTQLTDAGSTGELDIDNMAGGAGSAENVFFTNPPAGSYKVEVVLYRMDGNPPVDAVVIVQARDREPQRYPIRLTNVSQRLLVTTVNLN